MPGFEVSIGAITDVGLSRDRNEDAVGVGAWMCSAYSAPAQSFSITGEEAVLLVVADGLGGHPHGDVASRMVIQSLTDHRTNMTDEEGILGEIIAANQLLHDEMSAAPIRAGMGATVAGMVATSSHIFVFNVGDSTVLEYLGGYLVERSKSDGNGVSNGIQPPNTVVDSALGGMTEIDPNLSPHVWSDEFGEGRRFLLCTDGLTNFATIEQMEQVLQTSTDDARAAERLLELAFERDAPDNVSIVVATIRLLGP